MLDSKTIMYAHLPPLQKQFAAMGPRSCPPMRYKSCWTIMSSTLF